MTRRLALLCATLPALAQSPAADLNRVKVGDPAPAFELSSASGAKVSLSSLKGKNVVLVFYRGYW
jgi:cytochrome oxidase Cu insertion factor (SCO1/SenC/PrrC family)